MYIIIRNILVILLFLTWSNVTRAEGLSACESSISCQKNEDGSYTSAAFDDMCQAVSETITDTDRVAAARAANALLDGCKDVSDSEIKKNCETAANNFGTTNFSSCGFNYGKEDETSKNAYENALNIYCSNVCYIEEAGGADKDNFAQKLWGFVKEAAKNIYAFIKNMVSCIVGIEGEDVHLDGEDGPRAKMVARVWYENAFEALLFGFSKIATNSGDLLAKTSISLLGIFFALWIAFRIMKVVGSLREVNPYSYLTDMGRVFFRAIIAVVLINSFKAGIFDNFFIPVSQAFSLGSQLILDSVDVNDTNAESKCGDAEGSGNISDYIKSYDLEVKKNKMVPNATDPDKDIINEVSYAILTGLISMNARLMLIISDGVSALKWSFVNGRILCIIPDPSVLLTGLLMICFAGVLAIIVPLKYIDVILRIGLVFCLMPLFLVCWVFPSTRKYATKAFDLFMHGMILILILAVVTIVNIKAIDMAFGNTIGCVTERELVEAVDISKGGFNKLLLMMLLMIGSVKFLVIAPQLASSFVNVSPGTKVGDGLSKMATNVGGKALGVAAIVGGTVVGHAKDKIKEKAKQGGDYLKGKAGSAINKFKTRHDNDAPDLSVSPSNKKTSKQDEIIKNVNNASEDFNKNKLEDKKPNNLDDNKQEDKLNQNKQEEQKGKQEENTQNKGKVENAYQEEKQLEEQIKSDDEKVENTSSKADEKVDEISSSSPQSSKETPKDKVELSNKVDDVKKDVFQEVKNKKEKGVNDPIIEKIKNATIDMSDKKNISNDKEINSPKKDDDKE